MTEKEHILVADDERNIRKNAGSWEPTDRENHHF
jgi:hypothetical protein